MWKSKGNERKRMEMNHGFPTQRSPEPEGKSRGERATIEQLITAPAVDCCTGRKWWSLAGSQQGARTRESQSWCWCWKEGGEAKQLKQKKRTRALPTITNWELQVYFILALVPKTLTINSYQLMSSSKLLI